MAASILSWSQHADMRRHHAKKVVRSIVKMNIVSAQAKPQLTCMCCRCALLLNCAAHCAKLSEDAACKGKLR